jgi:hypothetical protein
MSSAPIVKEDESVWARRTSTERSGILMETPGMPLACVRIQFIDR